ncbi:MAG: hypothetical protein H6R28_280 [Methanomicrobiales archaeon]|nr:hypothetical protein [Methanomicrobiales archaeon]
MQLPRGKFREIVRGVPLGPLLLELNEVQYTGILKTTWDTSTGTLVFQNGLVILAEYPPYAGDAAWEAITRLGNRSVGGILSDLDAVQMRLVIEFNGPFLLAVPATPGKGLAGPGKGPAPAGAPVPPRMSEPVPVPATGAAVQPPEPGLFPPRGAPSIRQEPAKAAQPIAAAGAVSFQSGRTPGIPPRQTGTAMPAPEGAAMARPMAALSADHLEGGTDPGPGHRPQEMDPATLASLEMEALDDVDVDHIANKVRKNARGIVKKLHLGHLMTEKDE